jgi:hypothetical protein
VNSLFPVAYQNGVCLGTNTNALGTSSDLDDYRNIRVVQVDCDPYVAIGTGGNLTIGWYNPQDIGVGETCEDHIQPLPSLSGTQFTFDLFITE